MVRRVNPTNSPRSYSSDMGSLAYIGYWFSVYTSLGQIPNPAGFVPKLET